MNVDRRVTVYRLRIRNDRLRLTHVTPGAEVGADRDGGQLRVVQREQRLQRIARGPVEPVGRAAREAALQGEVGAPAAGGERGHRG
ncbi:hypothetical protein, partial [Burkholderia sp. Tr-860]|uniref:hypothetical protein n=1 Tax=Burkholderia sp. Tr-860 TaxID=2608338 RepID=UPI001965A420